MKRWNWEVDCGARLLIRFGSEPGTDELPLVLVLGVASILRTGVQIDFCPENTDFVPRGHQDSARGLTPGTDKKGHPP